MRFAQDQEQLIEDRKGENSQEESTFEKIRILASSLVPGIEFTVDLPGRHQTGRVPMLDVEVWKGPGNQGGTVVWHCYYEKPSTCPLVFHGSGAVATRQKIVTLAEE